MLRLGGDEFAMLWVADAGKPVVEAAQRAFADAPLATPDGGRLSLRVSVGLASALLHQTAEIDTLYRQADDALYRAKSARRSAPVAVRAAAES